MGSAMPLAALTVMLWLLWSDSIRKRTASFPVYALRAGLYLTAVAVLLFNLTSRPDAFIYGGRTAAIVAVVVGLLGALLFARKAVMVRRPR